MTRSPSRSASKASFAAFFAWVGCTGGPDLDDLRDPQACAACHPDHTREWSGSMHAYAADDPLFLALNAKGQRETGGELGDFCVRCHAPTAVALGLTDDGLNLADLEPGERGVTCVACHFVDGVEGDHNNPLTYAEDGVMRGGVADPVGNAVHASRYSPLLDRNDPRSARLCGSCHDIVTPAGVHIERTFLEWRESLYARNDLPGQDLSCGNCHMRGVDGPVVDRGGGREYPERRKHAHTWPAVDIALTEWPEREEQRRLVEGELATVLNPQLCVSVDPVLGNSTITVDLENLAAGHSFPSGAAADRRVWVELVAYEGGEEVFVSGRVPDGVPVRSVDDRTRWELGDRHYDEDGAITHLFWEVRSYDSELLPAPGARDPADPRWIETHRIRPYVLEGVRADRVELRAWLRPFGLEIADLLIAEEGLDPAIRAAIPTFELSSAALTWTEDLGRPCAR